MDLFFHKEPKERVQQKIGQQIRINRSKMSRGLAVKEDIKDLADKLVLVVVFYDVVAALEQK